jgi:hypothetical protein
MTAETSTKYGVHVGGDQDDSTEVGRLKRSLLGYREVLVPLNKVIEWEQNYYPAVLVGIITLLFSIIWYLEPSVLTTISLLCLFGCVSEFAIPTISAQLQRSSEWTELKDIHFQAICVHLCNAKQHAANVKMTLLALKQNKPNAYLLVMIGTFVTMAWFGSQIDNLLLTYLIVVGAVLVPGLRKHGILQKVLVIVNNKIASLRKNQQETSKAKVN